MGRKKGITRCKIGLSVDIDTWNSFEKWCESFDINKSKLVNKLLNDFMKNRQLNKNKHNG